jgi:hypothetical protein
MARRVTYEPCPKCQAIGRDTSADNLVIFADGGGHCFACSYHRPPVGGGNRNINRYLEEDEVSKGLLNAPTVLPSDFTRQVPSHAWKWLLQYGLSLRYWLPYVGWSEKDSRLVFTVGDPAEFSLGRYIPGESGEGNQRKWFAYGDCHQTAHVFGDPFSAQEVVLVEDLISAHKVGSVGCAIPLFGTKIFEAVFPVLRHLKLPVVIWLDKDQEQTLSKKAYSLASLTGLQVTYLTTEQDPKCLSTTSIQNLLTVSLT